MLKQTFSTFQWIDVANVRGSDEHDAAEHLLSVLCAVPSRTHIIWPQTPQKRHIQAWW
jgi:hypothetical protein